MNFNVCLKEIVENQRCHNCSRKYQYKSTKCRDLADVRDSNMEKWSFSSWGTYVILFVYFWREGKGGRKWGRASHSLPEGPHPGPASNPGTALLGNQPAFRPFRLWDVAQPSEPHRPGLAHSFQTTPLTVLNKYLGPGYFVSQQWLF